MSEIQPFDTVRLLSGLPEHGIPAGARAVVLEVHSEPHEAYEVEVVDELGQTIFTGAVEPAQCEIEVFAESAESCSGPTVAPASGIEDRSMKNELPHAKFPHMSVVLRVDRSSLGLSIESLISAVAVFDDHNEAVAESQRLQDLRPDGDAQYLVLPTRHRGRPRSDG